MHKQLVLRDGKAKAPSPRQRGVCSCVRRRAMDWTEEREAKRSLSAGLLSMAKDARPGFLARQLGCLVSISVLSGPTILDLVQWPEAISQSPPA